MTMTNTNTTTTTNLAPAAQPNWAQNGRGPLCDGLIPIWGLSLTERTAEVVRELAEAHHVPDGKREAISRDTTHVTLLRWRPGSDPGREEIPLLDRDLLRPVGSTQNVVDLSDDDRGSVTPLLDLVTESTTLVVTRHQALLAYLVEEGIAPAGVRVIAHATADDVLGMHVVGVLPPQLAALAATVTQVTLDLPPEARGKELSIDDLRRYAGPVATYVVREVSC